MSHQVEHVPIAHAVARAAFRAGARRVHAEATDLHIRKAAIELGPRRSSASHPSTCSTGRARWRETPSGNHPARRQSGPQPVRRARPGPRRARRSRATLREIYLPLVDGAARQLGDRPGAEPRLGDRRSSASPTSSASGRRLRRRCASTPRIPCRPGRTTPLRSRPARTQLERAAASTRSGSAARARISSSASWMPHAGCARRSRRRPASAHLPNIPTEEVFTTPDWRRTAGVARSTYPLIVPGIGARVDGLEVRFEDGKIVDVQADGDGADLIRSAARVGRPRRRFSARSRLSTARRGSARPASSSTTHCSTRTPAATSPTAAACRWPSTASTVSAPTSSS